MKNFKNLVFVSALLFAMIIIGSSCHKGDPEPENLPNITTFTPTIGPKGTVVTIQGENLGESVSEVSVFFNDVPGTVQSVSHNTNGLYELVAVVPARAYTGAVKVVVNGHETIGNDFTYTITDLNESVLAGATSSGYVDASGVNAKFYKPNGMVIDSHNNIFVADSRNNRIRKITPSGAVFTFAGSDYGFADGQGSAAKFKDPYDIVIDANDNLFVADNSNHSIRKITPDGTVSTIIGDGTFSGGVYEPYAIAIDSHGDLFVTSESMIYKITQNGTKTLLAGGGSGYLDANGAAAMFNFPRGLVFDAADNLYVTDNVNYKIRKIAPNGDVTTFAGSTQGFLNGAGTTAKFNNLNGIAIDAEGIFYAMDSNRVRKIKPDGFVSSINITAIGYGYGICVNKDDYTVYTSESSLAHRIHQITQE